ncbi:MAG: tetratricopeptide repeat protein [Rhodobacteraceae bacterium]|nr:tetratricopeptide repeat protein [Paracoccaceae bacterium]
MKPILMTALLCAAMGSPAAAETCPPPLAFESRKAQLLETLQGTRNENAGRFLTRELLALWSTAPDRRAQTLLDLGMELRDRQAFDAAEGVFEQLIAYCPAYAEGYNQRAFLRYLVRDFDGALADLDAALTRDPHHAAAMAGKAMALMQLGRVAEGQETLRLALQLNPWLPERRMLITPPGELL